MAENDKGYALDWDMTEAEAGEGHESVLLPEGIYQFEVRDMKRERFEGSPKMAACPRAHLELKVTAADGTSSIVHERLMLNSKMVWKVGQFFEAIGAPRNPDSDKVMINWNAVEGKAGWLKLKVRSYTTKDGEERQSNEVAEFLRPGDERIPASAFAPVYQPPQPAQAQMPVPVAPAPAPNQWTV